MVVNVSVNTSNGEQFQSMLHYFQVTTKLCTNASSLSQFSNGSYSFKRKKIGKEDTYVMNPNIPCSLRGKSDHFIILQATFCLKITR